MNTLAWILSGLERHWPEVVGVVAGVGAQILLARWLLEPPPGRRPAYSRAVKLAAVVLCVWVFLGFFFSIRRFGSWLPASSWVLWLRGLALTWAMASVGAAALWFLRRLPRYNPSRRRWLQAASGALVAGPFAGLTYGIVIQRTSLRIREVRIPIPGLPQDLDGLRVAHLSDIHLSAFLSESDLERAVEMANSLRPHLAVITGDLVSWSHAPLEACLERLARIRADAGILGCLGNHEGYVRAESYAALRGASLGIEFLRQRALPLRFGASVLNVAGVDFQPARQPYLVGADAWMLPGAVNLLLSHNPDVFPVAARQGYQLTLSGHTHGGQLALELFDQHLCAARFITPYTYGVYREGSAAIYVTRGIGTVGIPARVGAPPEVALIRLCAT